MSLVVDRLKHQTKIFVGRQLEKYLSRQYWRGKGPASRLISAFSEQAKQIGVEQRILVSPVPLKKKTPDYFLQGEIEREYCDRLMSGDAFTDSAGIFSARNVDVSFPTGMHQVGNYILNEVMLAPYLLTNPKYYFGLESMRFKKRQPMDEGVLLSMPWHHNFYHWMIEMLPRLISYDRCPSLQNVPLIVPKSAPKFVAESLRLTGYLPKTVFLDNGTYRFKTLHMLSKLAPTTEVSPDAVEWLNEKVKVGPSGSVLPKRFYVSRRDAKIRFVSNETQLTNTLSEFGFETLAMSKLSLADQIRSFSYCRIYYRPAWGCIYKSRICKAGSNFYRIFFQRTLLSLIQPLLRNSAAKVRLPDRRTNDDRRVRN